MLSEYIATLLEPRASYNNWDNFWYEPPTGGATLAGPTAGADSAMHVAAFFNGVRIIAETLAQVPLILYEGTGPETKERARENPLYNVLHKQPNAFQSSYEFRLLQTTNVLLGGNAYAKISGGNRGAVEQLDILSPSGMRPKKLQSGRIGYMHRDERGTETPYTQDEIFHVRAFPLSPDGVTGQGLLTYARQTVGLAHATETFGARLFNTDAKMRGNYSVPGTLTKEQVESAKQQIQSSNGLMILQGGATWMHTGMTAADAEFLLTRKFEITEIARWLNMQPHLLKDLERATFSNIEHQSLEFLQITMLPYFVNWEQAILRDLIVQKHRFFAEFLVDGLVRADIVNRYNAYATGINTGFMTRNEARGKENWNKAPGLDTYLVDQNKAIVDKTGKITPVNKPEGSAPAPAQPDVRREAAHYKQLLLCSSRRVMHAEAREIERAWKKDQTLGKLSEWADKFYTKHAEFAAEVLQIHEITARKFAEDRKDRFILSVKDNSLHDHVHETEKYGPGQLIAFLENGDREMPEAA